MVKIAIVYICLSFSPFTHRGVNRIWIAGSPAAPGIALPLVPPQSYESAQRWLLTPSVMQYSMYGHIKNLVEAEKRGIEKAGGTADVFQYVETSL
jgi:hypothetical protein